MIEAGIVAVGYVRVSTANQVLGDGLSAQGAAILEWARRGDHEVIGVCEDEGRSGTVDETERPGLLSALTRIEDGSAHALVVHRLDRLARALHVQEAVLARVWRAGGRVVEAVGDREAQQDDPDDPMRSFVRQVMGAAAQLERGMVVARLQGGRHRARARGEYVGGWTPFGFERYADKLLPQPQEQRLVGEMAAWRRGGATYREIAMRLNAAGISAKGGGPWGHTSVRAVLMRAGQ